MIEQPANGGERTVIRQAISCDVCGTEMQHANHWFVAIEQNGELRVSNWNPRSRLRAGAKHLCGQTCLHKLVDEFLAHTLSGRTTPVGQAEQEAQPAGSRRDAAAPGARQLKAAQSQGAELQPTYIDEFESSARLIPTVSAPGADSERAAEVDSPAGTRKWRAEAWRREREREQNQSEHRTKPLSRRRSIA